MGLSDKEIKRRVKEGSILAKVTFEVVGKPKEHVEKSLKNYVENLKKDERIEVAEEYYDKPEEVEGGLWSVFAEVDILFRDLDVINWVSVNFLPASIEILDPSEMRVTANQLTNWFNDTISKMHEISVNFKNVVSENRIHIKNINALIKNFILFALSTGSLEMKELEKKVGIPSAQLKPFVEHLEKKGKIVKKGKKYSLKQ